MTQNKYNKGDQVQIANGDWVTITGYGLDDVRFSCDKYDCTLSTDLITDHRPAFDWDTVKSGMAFLWDWDVGTVFYYVGPDPFNKDVVYMTIGEDTADVKYKYELTRHPEGDIKEEV